MIGFREVFNWFFFPMFIQFFSESSWFLSRSKLAWKMCRRGKFFRDTHPCNICTYTYYFIVNMRRLRSSILIVWFVHGGLSIPLCQITCVWQISTTPYPTTLGFSSFRIYPFLSGARPYFLVKGWTDRKALWIGRRPRGQFELSDYKNGVGIDRGCSLISKDIYLTQWCNNHGKVANEWRRSVKKKKNCSLFCA